MKFLKQSKKKEIVRQVCEFGICKIHYLLLRGGKDKIRMYSGGLSREELGKLDNVLNIEGVGLYFGKEHSGEVRLSLDALGVFKDEIKNILEVSDEMAEKWLSGNDLDIEEERGFKILMNNGDLIGCGKSTGEKIVNFMPKERRVG